MWQRKLNNWGYTITMVLGLVQWAATVRGQDVNPAMATTNQPPEAEVEETPGVENEGRRYNIRLGRGGLNFSAGLQLRYVDNVFVVNTGRRDDFVITPTGEVAFFYPLGQTTSNTIVLDVGVSYYQYTQNKELNTGVPIISPTSEVAFNLRSGNFTFRPSEAFSYQESPVYEQGGEFFNVEDTGRLARFDNLAGLALRWDQNNLVVDAGYYHENLWARDAFYSYINHSSELLNADAFYSVSSRLATGVETWGSINRFDNQSLFNSWRVRGGPGVRWELSQSLNARLGGGYERIEYDSGAANATGLQALNSFYFYARLEHQLSEYTSQVLEGSHDNQLGYNAGNLEGYHVTYALNWRPRERLTITPTASVNWYHEAFGTSVPDLYDERFTYYLAGVTAAYELGLHWRASVSWAFRLDDSNLPGRDYYQNQAAIQLLYAF